LGAQDHVLSWNPAAAGSHDATSIGLFYRHQWTEVAEAPRTLSAAVHAPLWNRSIALGASLDHDRLGPFARNRLRGHFAWRAVGQRSTTALGVAAGARYEDADLAALDAAQAGDPAFLASALDQWGWDASAGFFHYSEHWMIGASCLDLAGDRQYHLGSAAMIRYGQGHGIRPHALLRYPESAPWLLDAGLRLLFAERFWIGGSVRSNWAWSVEFLLELPTETPLGYNAWTLGYAYQVPSPEAGSQLGAGHELQLRFLLQRDKSREWSPRFY
jgi:type IX secretion system PorP/SprF family membrane protein